MVQSGPDPIAAEAPLSQATGETRPSNAEGAPRLAAGKKCLSQV